VQTGTQQAENQHGRSQQKKSAYLAPTLDLLAFEVLNWS
jgi:hypothetical protein